MIASVFSSLVALYGAFICYKILIPDKRFDNLNLSLFYLTAFSYLLISMLPNEHPNQTFTHHGQQISVVAVCKEVFIYALVIIHINSVTSVFLLTVARKYKETRSMQKYTNLFRELSTVIMFVCLAFVIPLRIDFKWLFTQPILYVLNAVFIIFSTPDCWWELMLNIIILIVMYAQLATVSILAILLLNLKVFKYGIKPVNNAQ